MRSLIFGSGILKGMELNTQIDISIFLIVVSKLYPSNTMTACV